MILFYQVDNTIIDDLLVGKEMSQTYVIDFVGGVRMLLDVRTRNQIHLHDSQILPIGVLESK